MQRCVEGSLYSHMGIFPLNRVTMLPAETHFDDYMATEPLLFKG